MILWIGQDRTTPHNSLGRWSFFSNDKMVILLFQGIISIKGFPMVDFNHWKRWFSDDFWVRRPLVTMVVHHCNGTTIEWLGTIVQVYATMRWSEEYIVLIQPFGGHGWGTQGGIRSWRGNLHNPRTHSVQIPRRPHTLLPHQSHRRRVWQSFQAGFSSPPLHHGLGLWDST